MLARQTSQLLAASDRQVSRLRWLRSGQCARCYHASIRRRAAGKSNARESPAPPNASKRGPTRQQRAAMISDEVQMLQRDHSSPSFGEADPNTLRPPGASQTVDPEAVGENVSAGRMGENDSTTQEGPQAQGAARVVASEDGPDATGLARGVSSPHETVEEPSQGGAAVLEAAASTPSTQHQVPQAWNETQISAAAQDTGPPTLHNPKLLPADTVFKLHSPATLAGAGPEGIIEERINSIANAGILGSTRDVGYLAHKLMDGHLVRFESKEEKAAVETAAKRIAEQRIQKNFQIRERFDNTKKPTHKFAPLPKLVLQDLVKSQVAGRYQGQRLLHGKTVDNKRPLLSNIARQALQNSTYLSNDRTRFMEKVESLLPKAGAPKAVARKPTPKRA